MMIFCVPCAKIDAQLNAVASHNGQVCESRKEHEIAELMRRAAKGGRDGARAKKEVIRRTLECSPNGHHEEGSESIYLSNEPLSYSGVLRLLVFLVYMAESLTSPGEGFVMSLSGAEQILVGFMIAVARLGFASSHIIWISWSIQVLLMSLSPSNYAVEHALLVIGLSSLSLVDCVPLRDDLTRIGHHA